MDALPIAEEGDRPHASKRPGVHHGCGHDGHTAILLGAAGHLARTRRFDGTVHFIFQPAEEGRGGARAMVKDGLFERFPCDAVYALHNWPDVPLGAASTRAGPIMAAADRFDIVVRGRGGHAAQPHRTPDTVLASSELVTQLHTIVSRRIPPSHNAVLSVTRISGGNSHNVLPSAVELTGTVRTFEEGVQDAIEAAMREIAAGVARASGTQIDVEYTRYYPATVNSEREAHLALAAAQAAGLRSSRAAQPAFTSEDFAFMLRERPGAYLWLGQGRPDGAATPGLHHPHYDFDDDALPYGIAWFVKLAQTELR
jgi:hippurate hydrolase